MMTCYWKDPGLAVVNLYYHVVMTNIALENPLRMGVLMGKSSINGQCSMAMLNNQRVADGLLIISLVQGCVKCSKELFCYGTLASWHTGILLGKAIVEARYQPIGIIIS